MTRESRLLLATIAVSGTVLLLLAQLRFPDVPTALPSAAPLERLAARASFEDLARRVAELEGAIAPNLIVLRRVPRAEPQPARFGDLTRAGSASTGSAQHVPALRLDATTAVAAVPPSASIAGIVGALGGPGTAGVAAIAPLQGLARVRVPAGAARVLAQRPLADLATPTYIVAVEGTQAGLTLRPVFLGRSDRFQSPRWSRPLLPLGGIEVTPGALMFTLDGEFLGITVVENGTLAIASAAETIETVQALQGPVPPPAEPGIALLPLTVAAAQVAHVVRGVLVAEVADGTPADGHLEPGDVLTDIAGEPAAAPESALLRLSILLGAGPVSVTRVRGGDTQVVTLQPRASAAPDRARAPALRSLRGGGVAVDAPGTALERAGVAPGDVIVTAGDIANPAAPDISRLLDGRLRGPLTLVVRRGDRRMLVLVPPGGTADDAP